MSSAAKDSGAASCKHPSKISACGIKVCMDCGAPLNDAARRLATAKASAA